MRSRSGVQALVLVALFAPMDLAAQGRVSPEQPTPADAYADATARQLVLRARRARDELGRSIVSYTALIRQRAAAMLSKVMLPWIQNQRASTMPCAISCIIASRLVPSSGASVRVTPLPRVVVR